MPRNLIGDPPFGPVLLFDEGRDFTLDDLRRIKRKRPRGVSLCIRYHGGPEKRGGYFFHFASRPKQDDEFEVYDFEKRPVTTFTGAGLVAFINHCTGRKFDEASFILCQTELNFLKDEEPGA
jgi:hypothetical protein